MTSLQLIDTSLVPLSPEHTITEALQWLELNKATHIPIVSDEKYEGLLDGRTVDLHLQKADTLQSTQVDWQPASVQADAHFLKAVSVSQLYRTNIIPVVNEREYQGSIVEMDLLHALADFCGAGEYGALLVLEIDRNRLALSEINSIIESDGATILHYNATPLAATPLMQVTIGLDKKEISTILANLERYQYKVLWYSGVDLLESEIDDNYQNLMNYLNI